MASRKCKDTRGRPRVPERVREARRAEGEKLREARLAYGDGSLTQKGLGDLVGVSKGFVSSSETGVRPMHPKLRAWLDTQEVAA